MSDSKKSILILDGVSSQALPIMRSFYKAGNQVTVVCPHRLCAGYFSRFAHKKVIWKDIYQEDDKVLDVLINYLGEYSVDMVLGLSDKTAALLSRNKELIHLYTRTIIPDYNVFLIASDKLRTMQFCMQNNIPCPYTLDSDRLDLNKLEEIILFPVIVKPKIGVGSVGVFKYNDPERLKKDYYQLEKEYGSLLIQEFIPNEKQYTVEVVCDQSSNVKACVIIEKARFFPVSGGTSCCNVTVHNSEIEHVVTTFLQKLKWIGSANLDVVFDKRDETPKIIEINPRVGAMVRIAFKAGVDIGKLQHELAFKREVQAQSEYNDNIVLRNLVLDIPWLISSGRPKLWMIKPSYFSFFGNNVFYQNASYDDPFISLGYVLSNLIKFMNPTVFAKKFLQKGKN